MARCLISFGANIGDARGAVESAVEMLRNRIADGDVLTLSRLYKTPPVGGPSGQASFVNAVAALTTRLDPWEMWHVIRSIERDLGRERIRRWEARRIDLDVLLYEDVRLWTTQLKIPHPRMCMRKFILIPAVEVAAEWNDPVSQLTISQLAERVARGPASLTVVARPELAPGQLIQELEQTLVGPVPNKIACISPSDFQKQFKSDALSDPLDSNLTVFWETTNERVAWEDDQRELAIQLRLCEPEERVAVNILPMIGPRYLLATQDREWVKHELAAALEAMACTIHLL